MRGLSNHPQIVDMIKQGIDSISKHIDVTDVEFRVLVFPERTIPGLGMSGTAPKKEHIYIFLNPGHTIGFKMVSDYLKRTRGQTASSYGIY